LLAFFSIGSFLITSLSWYWFLCKNLSHLWPLIILS
jgi:hypothetical protein